MKSDFIISEPHYYEYLKKASTLLHSKRYHAAVEAAMNALEFIMTARDSVYPAKAWDQAKAIQTQLCLLRNQPAVEEKVLRDCLEGISELSEIGQMMGLL